MTTDVVWAKECAKTVYRQYEKSKGNIIFFGIYTIVIISHRIIWEKSNKTVWKVKKLNVLNIHKYYQPWNDMKLR